MNDHEAEFRKLVIALLAQDFEIFDDTVTGTCRLNGKKVRIDLFLRPRPHITARGFDDRWFGIETKWFSPSDEAKDRKFRKTVWQALQYSYSDFDVDGATCRPLFVLMALDGLQPGDAGFEDSVYHLVTRGRVGVLNRKDRGWEMRFAGGCYFSSHSGRMAWNPKYLYEY